MPARLAALIAVMLALAGLAACGGGDDAGQEYQDDFPQISRQIVSLGREVGETIEGAAQATDRELSQDFSDFADRLGEIEGRLGELEAPEELADEAQELRNAIDGVREALSDIADAAANSDPDAARQATMDLVERSDELRDARRALASAVEDL